MWKEFREFALKGSVLDMAVGLIIGAAFGKIITSFVSDILMPPIGLLLAKVDFANLFVSLDGTRYASLADAQAAGAATLNYGLFINVVIDFLITAFILFLIIKQVNRLRKPAPSPVAPETKDCPYCKMAVSAAATRCPYCTSELE